MNDNLNPKSVNQKKSSFIKQNCVGGIKTSFKVWWKDSWGFKPIFSYLYFLFIFLIKKKGTWIIPITSFVVVLIVLLIPRLANWESQNTNGYYTSVIGTIFYFAIIICGFFTVSYATTKSANLFNDCQTEGVEIIIISKPIERWQIIFSKFFTLFVASIFISFINLLVFAIGFAFSWDNSLVNGIGYGPTIGIIFGVSLLTCILFGSLTALFSLKFGRKVSSTLPFFIFSLLFMISITVSSLASSLPEANPVTSFENNLQNSSVYNKVEVQSIDYNDEPLLVVTQDSTDSWSATQSDLQTIWNSSKNNGWWYKFVKWIDIVLPTLDEQNYAWGGGIESSLVSSIFSNDYSYKVSTTDLPVISNDAILLNSSYQIYFDDSGNWTALNDFSNIYKNYINTIANSKQFSKSIRDYVNKQNVTSFSSLYSYFYNKENTQQLLETYQKLLDSWNITTISASDLIDNNGTYYDYAPLVFSLASLQVFYNNYYNNNNYAAIVNDFINSIDQAKNTSLSINELSSNSNNATVLDKISISIGGNPSSSDNSSNAVFSKYSYSGSDNNNGIFVIAPDADQSPNWGVIVFWCFITIALFSITTWMYFRNDFK